MVEVLDRRTENSKDYDLGGGKFRREITGQPQHYKDDYKDSKETWKDIDLTIVKGRVDKAPYIMAIDGNKVTVTDKKTGQTSVVELLKVGDTAITSLSVDSKSAEIIKDVDYDLVFNETKIKFQRTIKSAEALKEATFKITGDIPVVYSAADADGDKIEVQTTTDKSGNIVETFVAEKTLVNKVDGKETKTVPTYPIKIDPTLTIQGTGIDTYIYQVDSTTNYGTEAYFRVNGNTTSTIKQHALINMPLTDLPAGATRTSATFSAYYYKYYVGNPNTASCTLYKIRRADWGETTSTWNSYKTSTSWGTAGCIDTTTDIDTSLTAHTHFPASYGWMDWDVESIIADAVTNSLNFNVRMNIDLQAWTACEFYSREYATDTTKRPKLVIEYTVASTSIRQVIWF
jgi:hypothetical protein